MFTLLSKGMSSVTSFLQPAAAAAAHGNHHSTGASTAASTNVHTNSRISDFLQSVERIKTQNQSENVSPSVQVQVPIPNFDTASAGVKESVSTLEIDSSTEEAMKPERELRRRSTEGSPAKVHHPKGPHCEPGDIVEGMGVITSMEVGMSKAVIDGTYLVDREFCSPLIVRGSKVKFRARLPEASEQWQVVSVELAVEQTEEPIDKSRTVVGQIDKFGRGFMRLRYGKANDQVQELPLQFAVEQLGYHPTMGDFLRVKIEVEDIEADDMKGKLVSVEPTLRKRVVGTVSRYHQSLLTIDNYIYFDTRVCEGRWIPRPGETVCAHVVESAQEKFTWRAVSVTPSDFGTYTASTPDETETEGWLEADNDWSAPLQELQSNKHGVEIKPPKSVDFGGVRIGSSLARRVDVENSSRMEVVLRSVRVEGDTSVCTFRVEFERKESLDYVAMLAPNESCSIRIWCTPSMLGRTRELVVFDFEDFRIGRYLSVTALSNDEELLAALRDKEDAVSVRQWKDVRSDETVGRMIEQSKRPVVRGVQPIRTPFFMSKRLALNPVPTYMWLALKNKDEDALLLKHPHIKQQLSIRNYESNFQAALWLEEMENDVLRRQYDQERVVLHRSGEFYTFDVAGLKDFHPPVLIGDPISVYDNADMQNHKYEAYIHDIRGNTIYAKFNEQFRQRYDGTYVTVEFRLGRTTYKRCHHAVQLAVQYLGEDWLFPQQLAPLLLPRIPFIEAHSDEPRSRNEEQSPQTGPSSPTVHPREAQAVDKTAESQTQNLFRNRPEQKPVTQPKMFNSFGRSLDRRVCSLKSPFVSSVPEPDLCENLELRWFNEKLNQEQKDAVRRILRGQARPLPYIVFGPPGTGKTVTLVEAILQIYTLDKNSRTLVVAPSNSAADVIALHLAASKRFSPGDFVRLIGFLRQEGQIPDSIREFCSDGEQLDSVARNRLIVCTCTTAGQFFQLGLDSGHFTHVFIDEAGYCTEPEALIASVLVSLDRSGQVILAGDPKQLGPVLMSDVASRCGLSLSLLERLMSLPLYSRDEAQFPIEKYNPLVLTKLVRNYRAHPSLLKLPSKLFYDDELVSAVAEEEITLCHSLPFTKERGVPLLFHGLQGTCQRDPDSPSWFNSAEVIQVVGYVRQLRAHGLGNDDIGIITPYRKQVEKIRKALELGMLQSDLPKVGSVEEFQGGERKVMIMSLVRSAYEHQLSRVVDRFSFVFSPKRFNVGITRAKAVLVVVGNPHVMLHDQHWATFLRYCIELGAYTGCNLPLPLNTATKTVLSAASALPPVQEQPKPEAKYDSDGENCCDSQEDD